MTPDACAVVTAAFALIPGRADAGGSVSSTVTAYVTTLPDELAADGAMATTLPGTFAPMASIVTVAGWSSLSDGRSVSVKSAVACRGPLARVIAGPLVRSVPGTAATAVTVPSAGATIVVRATCARRSAAL